MIRRGSNRTVLLVGPWAFKFPTLASWRDFLFGLLNNQTEARVGRQHAGACPVLWHLPGGWLVVMPRVQTFTAEEWRAFNYAAWQEAHGPLCVEPKPCSFGRYAGRVVAVDYGWNN